MPPQKELEIVPVTWDAQEFQDETVEFLFT